MKNLEGTMTSQEIATVWEARRENANYVPRDHKGYWGALRLLVHLYGELEGFKEIASSYQVQLKQTAVKIFGFDHAEVMKAFPSSGHNNFFG